MSPRPDYLRDKLRDDVERVIKEGLNPAIGPNTVPVLVRLAEHVNSKAYDDVEEYYSSLVEGLLHTAIDQSAPGLGEVLRRKGPAQAALCLRELLGIAERGPTKSFTTRCNHAGNALGYADEVFRRSQSSGVPNLKVISTELVRQLLTIAEEAGFVYVGPSSTSIEEQTVLEEIKRRQRRPNGFWALRAFHFGRLLFDEMHRLCMEGFEAASRSDDFPALTAVAEQAAHTRYRREEYRPADLEEVLSWAIDQIPDSGHRQGATLCFGLGDASGQDLSVRRDLAAPYFGFKDGQRFFFDHKESWIIHFVRDQIVILAGEMDFWPEVRDPGAIL
jgi:hypothetical protein